MNDRTYTDVDVLDEGGSAIANGRTQIWSSMNAAGRRTWGGKFTPRPGDVLILDALKSYSLRFETDRPLYAITAAAGETAPSQGSVDFAGIGAPPF